MRNRGGVISKFGAVQIPICTMLNSEQVWRTTKKESASADSFFVIQQVRFMHLLLFALPLLLRKIFCRTVRALTVPER